MQTPYIHIMAQPNQSPILRPELARTDIVQKERERNQNQREKNIWEIGQIMRRKKRKDWSSRQELQKLWTHK
jgi:hypothetical protein